MEKVTNEILKASVKNDRCEVTFKENFTEANYSNEVSKKCSQIVHSDLVSAIDKLKVHLVVVCEQPEAVLIGFDNINDINLEQLENYIVTGFTIGGNDESAGVTIIGQKLLKSGQVLNLISPFIKFQDTEAYPFAGELYVDVQSCEWEVSEYMFSEKWGIKQMEFDFDNPEGAEVTITDGVKKKARKVKMQKLEEMAEITEND